MAPLLPGKVVVFKAPPPPPAPPRLTEFQDDAGGGDHEEELQVVEAAGQEVIQLEEPSPGCKHNEVLSIEEGDDIDTGKSRSQIEDGGGGGGGGNKPNDDSVGNEVDSRAEDQIDCESVQSTKRTC